MLRLIDWTKKKKYGELGYLVKILDMVEKAETSQWMIMHRAFVTGKESRLLRPSVRALSV